MNIYLAPKGLDMKMSQRLNPLPNKDFAVLLTADTISQYKSATLLSSTQQSQKPAELSKNARQSALFFFAREEDGCEIIKNFKS